mgnify:FL=1
MPKHEKPTPRQRARRRAAKVALIYAVFATLWILFSDLLVELAFPPGYFRMVQSIKGVLFVLATTLVLLGTLRRAFGTIEVSNEKLRVEEKIVRSALAEQKGLLLELHHRVKNNLQLINSLLSLQSGAAGGGDGELRRAQERILSVALVHKLAYREGRIETVEVAPFLNELTAELCREEESSKEGPDLEKNLENITLEVTRAVPLGIIAQELITNAERHAFPATERGRIRLSLQVREETMLLTVADNGKGLPEESFREGTGFLILRTLVEQLNAELRMSGKEGTRVEVRIPRAEPATSPL